MNGWPKLEDGQAIRVGDVVRYEDGPFAGRSFRVLGGGHLQEHFPRDERPSGPRLQDLRPRVEHFDVWPADPDPKPARVRKMPSRWATDPRHYRKAKRRKKKGDRRPVTPPLPDAPPVVRRDELADYIRHKLAVENAE